ncbi:MULTISPECIES: methyltransferase [unclassified Clostridium]|uniref:methyltransferase n=1 Tax=unclassified Clostridium TaxID=2614128 RepID=UPI000EC9ECEA|nr:MULTISPECIES: methyltransferase [unclassified Clostridium]HCQ88824.1 methyltransferase [Clostridium sp.]
MKDVKYDSRLYYNMVQNYKETQLLFSAIKLDIFSNLKEFTSTKEVAINTGYDERNLGFYLNTLASIGLLEKKDGLYKNTLESEYYLNKKSDHYLGEWILFREKMTSLNNIENLVKNGPKIELEKTNEGANAYNFSEFARLSVNEIYSGRIQSFLKAMEKIYSNNKPNKILDLGGGSGIMAIEFINAYPQAKGVIFEHPKVAEVPMEFVKERNLEDKIQVIFGDFNVDSIGSGYDVVIASGIIDFSKNNPDFLIKKIYDSLNDGGYIYLVSHEVSEDYLRPRESIVGWLSSHLEGLDILLTKKTIVESLERIGFSKVQEDFFKGTIAKLTGEFYQKNKPLGEKNI